MISNYNNSTDLHIAVTTSQGLIIEYDRQGLKRLSSGESDERWEQSLSVTSLPEAWHEHWDETLKQVRVVLRHGYNKLDLSCQVLSLVQGEK